MVPTRRWLLVVIGALAGLSSRVAAQEPTTITGRVTSDAGVPLAFVNVTIPSLGLGALTKDDGHYVIAIPGARVTSQVVTLTTRVLGYSNEATGSYLGSTVAPNRAGDLNPKDIASVEILKGAASGAIYGSRAGQGVVLITTKGGQAGPTRYSLRTSISADRVTHGPPLQTIFGQGSGGNPPSGTTGSPPVCNNVGCSVTSGSR